MTRFQPLLALGLLAAGIHTIQTPARAQAAKSGGPGQPAVLTVEQPDAQRTKDQLSALLEHYPPALRGVLALDPNLLDSQSYLAPYPALVSFLNAHPEVTRNPAFYVGDGAVPRPKDTASRILDIWSDVLNGLAVFIGFSMAVGLAVWLIRTLVDYRRWSRLAKVQTDAHTKLLDRFTANEDLLAYVQSPAGAKFLESSPIALDAAPRSVGAPLSRILWSVQGGVVLMAGGIGLQVVSGHVTTPDASQPLHALGVLAIALGLGFVISAIISYVISLRLGLVERPPSARRITASGS
ncbi:MAG TPA: hypothetical protein VKR61_11570 [Bryobacteraceae bacterium]|nr:hypothetical protein [Bryobacteraceae bacterium]